jgi:phage terminase small subunit
VKGRKPVSTALKLLRGNPGKRRVSAAEPQPGALDATCPPELVDPVSRDEWDRVIAPAIQTGHITAADRTLAVAPCTLWSLWRAELAEASTQPHVIYAGLHKYPRPNPARLLSQKTLLLLTRVDESLGFTSTSRSRVAVQRPAPTLTTFDKRRARFLGFERG